MISRWTAMVVSCLAMGGVALAQPDAQTPPKAANPPNAGQVPQTPEQRAQQERDMEAIMRKAMESGLAISKLPPEQQRQKLRQLHEDALRMELTANGFKDKNQQDAIVRFIAVQEKEREKVRRAASKVYLSLSRNAVTDRGMSALLTDYLAAVEDAREQREAATNALDAEIGFRKKPHLLAMLTVKGLVGDAGAYTADLLAAGSLTIGALAPFLNPAPAAR